MKRQKHSKFSVALPLAQSTMTLTGWLASLGNNGLDIIFPLLPAGLDDFVDKVVPELQKRGIFRKEYEGRTLRENLELPRPKNRFFEG